MLVLGRMLILRQPVKRAKHAPPEPGPPAMEVDAEMTAAELAGEGKNAPLADPRTVSMDILLGRLA